VARSATACRTIGRPPGIFTFIARLLTILTTIVETIITMIFRTIIRMIDRAIVTNSVDSALKIVTMKITNAVSVGPRCVKAKPTFRPSVSPVPTENSIRADCCVPASRFHLDWLASMP
jgi:hypothetical protein